MMKIGQQAKNHLYSSTHSSRFKAIYCIINMTLFSVQGTTQIDFIQQLDSGPHIQMCSHVSTSETPGTCVSCIRMLADDHSQESIFSGLLAWDLSHSNLG